MARIVTGLQAVIGQLADAAPASPDDWFDYQLENDPRFLQRAEEARRSLSEGRGVRLEDMKTED